jgi:hypothetical protein
MDSHACGAAEGIFRRIGEMLRFAEDGILWSQAL